MVGAGGLTPAQIAHWEDVLERSVNTAEWKRSIEADSAVWRFMKAQATREFLKKENDADRALLVELGMVK
jgi:tripartite-type tricarboxylate transporter receptor subunit TctC